MAVQESVRLRRSRGGEVTATSIDGVLAALENALELERELGVCSIEIDRSLLAPPGQPAAARTTPPERREAPPRSGSDPVVRTPAPPRGKAAAAATLTFLHDGAMSPGGAAMTEKIIAAMGVARTGVRLVTAPPAPESKVSVALGAKALRKFFPGVNGEPGQWLKTPCGEVLVTYSPEYVLRFAKMPDVVRRLKRAMWASLKAVVQRLA